MFANDSLWLATNFTGKNLTCGLCYKCVTIVIYNRITVAYTTKLNYAYSSVALALTLALAGSVYYDLKVSSKLKHTFMIVTYL